MDQGPCHVPYPDIGSGPRRYTDCEGMKPIVQKKELEKMTPGFFLAKNTPLWANPGVFSVVGFCMFSRRTGEWLCRVVLDLLFCCQLSCIDNGMLEEKIRAEF